MSEQETTWAPKPEDIPQLISKIVSGGQTGVDRGALEAATALGLEFGGWAPHGWIAEDGTIPAQYRERMQEYPSMGGRAQDYRERTKANVRDSHATLILVDSLPLSGGTKLTENTAVGMMRSHKVIAMSATNAKDDALQWCGSSSECLRHWY